MGCLTILTGASIADFLIVKPYSRPEMRDL